MRGWTRSDPRWCVILLGVRRMRCVAVAMLAFAPATCGGVPPFEIAFAPAASLPAPEFTVNGRHAPQFIFVERVSAMRSGGATEMWALVQRRDAGPSLPIQVRYGDPPQGYRESRSAEALGPGEYRVRAKSVEQQTVLEFAIAPDGRVTPRH